MLRQAFSMVAILSVALGAMLVTPGGEVGAAPRPEFRAYWVDAFGEGIFNEAEIAKLVANAKAANMNAIVAQVGRRGDCFCNNAAMPRTQANIAPRPFDPLQALIDRAHTEGIEVHAWVIATAMWNSNTPPLDPNHAFNRHGPTKTGDDNWLGERVDGFRRESASSTSNWFFDPGHPDAADYIVGMYTSIVKNYDVDGINFDRIRYPDGNAATGYPANINQWGYNPVAVQRFQQATGRTDRPVPTDPQWMQWRRDQITNIVRRVYLESYALKPHVRISADTITYGAGPADPSYGNWELTRPYTETLQDWRGWMEEGILDLNIPMNYKREHCTQDGPGCFGNQRLWYEQWNEFAKDHQYRRQTAIGAAIYLNFIEGSIAQVRKALAPSAAGNSAVGWVGYSYRTPDCYVNSPPCGTSRPADVSRAELTRALTQPSEYDPSTPPVFAAPAAVPEMTWKTQPTTGHLLGTVKSVEGVALDQVRVDLYDAETDAFIASRLTDGSGVFGFVDLPPGRYKAIVDGERAHGQRVAVVSVTAGGVAVATIEAKDRAAR